VTTVHEGAGCTRNDRTGFLKAGRIEMRILFSGSLLQRPAFETIGARNVSGLVGTDTVMGR